MATYPEGSGLAPNDPVLAKPWTYDAGVVGEVIIGARSPDLVPGVPPVSLVTNGGIQVYGGGSGAVLPTQTTIFEVRNWKITPPSTVVGALAGGPDAVTTLVFEGSNAVAGQQWVPIVAVDAFSGQPLQSLDIPPYASGAFSRFIHVPSYSYSLVRLRAKTYKTAAWLTVSGTGVGGLQPVPVINQFTDLALRASGVVGQGGSSQAYCINSERALFVLRGGVFTNATIAFTASVDGTNWYAVRSTYLGDGTQASTQPVISSQASLPRGYYIGNLGGAFLVRVTILYTTITTGITVDVGVAPDQR